MGKIAGLDVHKFAEGMLDAKAQIDHLSPADLVTMDSKVFKIGGKKIRVSVLETTQPAAPLAKKQELIAAQKKAIADEALDDMLFFIVDILKEAATFLSCSATGSKLVERAWNVKVGTDDTVVLAGVLSRKKQIIPK